jgi:arylsulfatase A-like enzyme
MNKVINRRNFLKTIGLFTAGIKINNNISFKNTINTRPNVILIITDDQGYGDIGVHGNDKVKTPTLDKFADEGIEFTRFYCNPVCSPTRAGLMTGRHYYRTGVIHTSRGGAKMHGDEVTIAERFRDAGYKTGIFGKWHLGDNYPMRPQDQGFEESLVHKSGGIGQSPDKPNSYFNPLLWHNGKQIKTQGYCTDVFFNSAIQFIDKNRHNPFFVYLPTNAPHTPLEIAIQYSEPYKEIGLNDATARVYGMVTNIDENIGKLILKLEELNLRENTLIIFLSDNGPQQPRFNSGLRGLKSSTYEGGIRVPFFLQLPSRFLQSRKINTISAHIDIFPTLLEICKINSSNNPNIDGISLLPLLEGIEENLPERKLFLQCHRGLEPKQYQNCAVITQIYKMVGSPETFLNENFKISDVPVLELYDLVNDPSEKNNIADKYPEIVSSLRKSYDTWFEDVKRTRNFTPGYIHIGSESENPSHLCRYQDSTYKDEKPTGWSVYIEHGGRYELTINRGDSIQKGKMYVKINDKEMSQSLERGVNSAIFNLPSGRAIIDIWIQEEGKNRIILTGDDIIGDVDIKLLKKIK